MKIRTCCLILIATTTSWCVASETPKKHWAYQPIVRSPIPPADHRSHTGIDHFIVSALADRGLKLSPPVDRATLIRRATYDLTGLPPTWAEVEAFVNDTRVDAFARVIDRLLASPRYGERWGRHWLDLARYADTHGATAIGFKKFPFAYTYRDYVIAAFNDDTPYDRFVLEQIAADQLDLAEHDSRLAALGFLTVGRRFRSPHDIVDDQIDVVTRGLLGMTVACARCHDHKFDAIPTADYYALYATLASSREPAELPILGEPESTQTYREYQAELSRRKHQYEQTVREQAAVMRSRLRMQVGLYLRELAKGTPEYDLAMVPFSYRTDDVRPHVLERWRTYLAKFGQHDPVFGAWHRLAELAELSREDFSRRCAEVIERLINENGDLSKLSPMHTLAASPPRHNPQVIAALSAQPLHSMLDVADAYGRMFAEVHAEWSTALLEAAREAHPDGTVVPDQDPRHEPINSAIKRQLRNHLYGPDTPTAMDADLSFTVLNRTVKDHSSGLAAAMDDLHLTSPGSPPRAMALVEAADPPAFHVFRRGNPIDRGPIVEPRFLSAVTADEPPPFAPRNRRLALAEAIIDPANPLTRRVIVNWVWQHHFGTALARTPDDFGVRGEPPTHPELLDYLADSFFQDGWSLKQLHRRIMLSAVYRQAATENAAARRLDPENRLLWRMPRRRLDLEAMRDGMLATAGRLDTTMGGQPIDLATPPLSTRRTVYGFVNRDIVSGFASTFDMADPSSCTAQRPRTSVPQQTLFALNSAFIQEQAAAFATHPEVLSADSDRARVVALYRRAFSRLPSQDEIVAALAYVHSDQAGSAVGPWQKLAHILLASNEFIFLD